jgi:CrcB protein
MTLISILFFGMIGISLRYFIDLYVSSVSTSHFPISTFIINILGSFLIGVVYVLGAEKELLSPLLRSSIIVGMLGGFTTFSSYALSCVTLLSSKQFFLGLTYLILSPTLGLLVVWIAIMLTRSLIS